MVLDCRLFPVLPDALAEGLLAGEPIVEGGDAALVADNPTGHALDPVARVQALGCQVAAVQAARGGHEDVGSGGGRVAPVHKPEGVGGAGLGAIIGGELGNGDLA